MEEIIAWLSDSHATFESGFTLFCKRSRNQHIKNYIARKRDMRKLRYELGKFVPKQVQEINTTERDYDLTQKPHERLAIVNSGKIRFEDLPDDIKTVYQETVELYREMRSLHERLKIARSDADRAQLRKLLLSKDDERSRKWEIIDKWAETGELPSVKDTVIESEVRVNYKSVAAARTAVTRYVKELEANPDMEQTKRADMIDKTRQAAALVMSAGGKFDKLAEPLRKLGILER